MNLGRIQRLLQLIGLLQAGRGYNTDALAQACGISRRTVFRDLDLLRLSGVPLLFDEKQQRYRIPAPACCRPPTSRRKKPSRFWSCATSWATGRGLPFLGPARSAALKLESNLPARLREQLRDVTAALHIHPAPSNPLAGCQPVYDQLLAAAANRQNVRIRYGSLKEEKEIVTRLSPYGLFFSGRSWYAVGRSSLHRAKRTFNLGRVLEIELLDDHFQIPAVSRSSGTCATPGA